MYSGDGQQADVVIERDKRPVEWPEQLNALIFQFKPLFCIVLQMLLITDVVSQDEGTTPVLWTMLQEWHTRIVKGSCNPLFGDQFSCFLPEDTLDHINLRMEVLYAFHYTFL